MTTGQLVVSDSGASTERTFSGPVNSTIELSQIDSSCLTIYGSSLEWSNSADFSSLVTPTAGLVIWEFTTDGVKWQQMYAGNYRPQDNYTIPPKAVGNIKAVRVVTSGIVGASYVRATINSFLFLDNGIDPRVYNGSYAVTVQSFIESNGKRGLSYEASFNVPSLAGGSTVSFVFITGQFISLIKTRQILFTGSGVTARVYKNPAYTGGTPVPFFNLNDNASMVIPTDVQILSGISLSSPGTEIAAPSYSIGTDTGGGNTIGTFALPGSERVLAPNTTYLLQITNDDDQTRRVAGYISWFSGRISTQS